MINFKHSNYFLSLCTTLLLPCIAPSVFLQECGAATFSLTEEQGFQQEKVSLESMAREKCTRGFHFHHGLDRLKQEKKTKPLTLEDFAGAWTFIDNSVGGVSGGSGTSVTIDMQIVFDKKGEGSSNFFTVATYNGVPGQEQFFTYQKSDVNLSIEIVDPVNGVGLLTSTIRGNTSNSYFIVTRSLVDGRVIKFQGHSNNTSLLTSNIRSFCFTRQYVE